MPLAEIKKVCFVGAGTMGCYNSLITALAGYQVALYDVSEQALEKAFVLCGTPVTGVSVFMPWNLDQVTP